MYNCSKIKYYSSFDVFLFFFISFLYSEDGQVLSKKALKKQAKQAKKDERKANVASKLVREIKRERRH